MVRSLGKHRPAVGSAEAEPLLALAEGTVARLDLNIAYVRTTDSLKTPELWGHFRLVEGSAATAQCISTCVSKEKPPLLLSNLKNYEKGRQSIQDDGSIHLPHYSVFATMLAWKDMGHRPGKNRSKQTRLCVSRADFTGGICII